MTPYYVDESVTLYAGDCLDVLAGLPDGSVDAVCTDPPYGLEFMGRDWDGADGFRRTLNPADVGRESVFGRTSRTSPEYRDRFVGAVTDRNFKGFVLSQQRTRNVKCPDCGKWAYDHPGRLCECGGVRRAQVSVYQAWCEQWASECLRVLKPGGYLLAFGGTRTYHRLTCAIEDAGFEIRDEITWLYGSGFPKNQHALKPGHEPIVVARRPLAATVAANVVRYGTGALNIDACRVEAVGRPLIVSKAEQSSGVFGDGLNGSSSGGLTDAGRWPTNVVFSHSPDCTDVCAEDCPVAELDRQSGQSLSAGGSRGVGANGYAGGPLRAQADVNAYGDMGGASRFFPTFRYEPKAPASERPRVNGQAHETVKPLNLMRWLVRLVTPAAGVVLDPFAGSGTTAEACVIEGFQCIAIEQGAKYLPLIVARLSKPLQPVLDVTP